MMLLEVKTLYAATTQQFFTTETASLTVIRSASNILADYGYEYFQYDPLSFTELLRRSAVGHNTNPGDEEEVYMRLLINWDSIPGLPFGEFYCYGCYTNLPYYVGNLYNGKIHHHARHGRN